MTDPLAIEARQRRNKKESVYAVDVRGFVIVCHVAPPILRLRKNSDSRVVQILIKRMRDMRKQ